MSFDLWIIGFGLMIGGGLITYPIAYLQGRLYQARKFGRKPKDAKAKI